MSHILRHSKEGNEYNCVFRYICKILCLYPLPSYPYLILLPLIIFLNVPLCAPLILIQNVRENMIYLYFLAWIMFYMIISSSGFNLAFLCCALFFLGIGMFAVVYLSMYIIFGLNKGGHSLGQSRESVLKHLWGLLKLG